MINSNYKPYNATVIYKRPDGVRFCAEAVCVENGLVIRSAGHGIYNGVMNTPAYHPIWEQNRDFTLQMYEGATWELLMDNCAAYKNAICGDPDKRRKG